MKNSHLLDIDKSKLCPPSPTLLINEQINNLLRQGKPAYHLGFGENRFPCPKVLIDEYCKYANKVSYLPTSGIAELREAIVSKYQQLYKINFKPEQIIVSPGSKAVIYACIDRLKGDVLLPRPSWVSYASQATLAGKQVTWIDTNPDNNFIPTKQEILKAISKAQNAGQTPGILIINSPNNPTGVTYNQHQCREIAEIAKKENLSIISDQLYSQILHNQETYYSMAKAYPEGTITIGGLSKNLAIGGWRLGWAILPDTKNGKALLQSINSLGSQIWSTVSSPIQFSVVKTIRNILDIKDYLQNIAGLHAARTKFLYQRFSDLGLKMPQPTGGFYLYVDFEKYRYGLNRLNIETSLDLQQYLLQKYRIAALAGSHFGDKAENLRLRISTCYLDCSTPKKSTQLFSRWVNTKNKKDFVNSQTHPEMFAMLKQFEKFIGTLI